MRNLRGFKNSSGQSDGDAQRSPEDLLKTYGNMSEEALFQQLMSEVSASKSKGTFSSEELKKNVDQMKPLLTQAQADKLEHLLRLISSN